MELFKTYKDLDIDGFYYLGRKYVEQAVEVYQIHISDTKGWNSGNMEIFKDGELWVSVFTNTVVLAGEGRLEEVPYIKHFDLVLTPLEKMRVLKND